MNYTTGIILLFMTLSESLSFAQQKLLPSLPIPISNNAVASSGTNKPTLFSFHGLLQGKTHKDVTNRAFALEYGASAWQELPPVPGPGRLASVAATVKNQVYIFGGYTVAKDGSEVSTPEVYVYDQRAKSYRLETKIPTPVDDSVALTYLDRYIYLVSGWHDKGNVTLVQIYDSQKKTWSKGTAYPGLGVFGHSAGIVGHQMLVCDGVIVAGIKNKKRQFAIHDACYLGEIDKKNPNNISWQKVAKHPGLPRYRSASVGFVSKGESYVAFVGGSTNPYNYNGIGYNGVLSSPLTNHIVFDFRRKSWSLVSPIRLATMDHRGLLPYGDKFITIGGMIAGATVTDKIVSLPAAQLLAK
ncbi:MAG: galactose oxidase [Pseudobacteriovorax sp.]|nr:galactose oxidase [Pseudobacteriovorax sp.]